MKQVKKEKKTGIPKYDFFGIHTDTNTGTITITSTNTKATLIMNESFD